jgi:hypothetical protein
MTQGCRNCGSLEIYNEEVLVEDMDRRYGFHMRKWYFDLRVCVQCGLTDWFFPQRDLGWVKRKFKRVAQPSEPLESASPKT